VDVELIPEQPREVDEAVARLLAQGSPPEAAPSDGQDPWWRAGLAEALDP
jgi:hypothetical protein